MGITKTYNGDLTVQEIQNNAIRTMDSVMSAWEVEATKPGMVPIFTGATQASTNTSIVSDLDSVTGKLSVGAGDYIEKIYQTGGIIPSGTPEWVEVALTNINVEEKVEEGMQI